jgi:hypothetical protein
MLGAAASVVEEADGLLDAAGAIVTGAVSEDEDACRGVFQANFAADVGDPVAQPARAAAAIAKAAILDRRRGGIALAFQENASVRTRSHP